MADEIIINSGEAVIPTTTTAADIIDAVEDTREVWERELSAAVTVMQELIAEVRASNGENQTLRSQVSELLTVNRDLTAQITAQSAQTTEALARLIPQVIPQNQTPHSVDSPMVTLENALPTEAVPVVIVPEEISEPPAPPRPKRRAM